MPYLTIYVTFNRVTQQFGFSIDKSVFPAPPGFDPFRAIDCSANPESWGCEAANLFAGMARDGFFIRPTSHQ
jgi:hypothetical protein